MNYSDIVNQFNLKKGDRIWLSSDIISLAMDFRKNGERLNQNELLEAYMEAVGQEGTIIIPTFNFDFSNHGHYDYTKSKGTTGALGNTALAREDFTRTSHPMHSFAVWGADREELAALTNNNSFGTDSPFGYCIQRHVKQIMLGTDYLHAFTFMHYGEAVCNVPYRYMKTFTGKYITAEGAEEERSYIYPVRKLEINPEERSDRLGRVLEDMGISAQYNLEGITSHMVDLAEAYLVICEDIIHNQCRNIYDFNIDRSEIFVF